MIEMLGVLAVIGVLSIGGLYAYRQAMDRYRSNRLVEFINRVWMIDQERVNLMGNKTFTTEIFCQEMENDPDFCGTLADAGKRKMPLMPGVVWYTSSNFREAEGLVAINSLPSNICKNFLQYSFPLKFIYLFVDLTRFNFRNGRIPENQHDLFMQKCDESSTSFLIIWQR